MQVNNLTPREIAKCIDPTAFGFELERDNDGVIQDGGTSSNPRDSLPLVNDYDREFKNEVVKSVIVQCATLEIRDRILQGINKRKREMKDAEDAFANPKHYQTLYMKRCQCAKIKLPSEQLYVSTYLHLE